MQASHKLPHLQLADTSAYPIPAQPPHQRATKNSLAPLATNRRMRANQPHNATRTTSKDLSLKIMTPPGNNRNVVLGSSLLPDLPFTQDTERTACGVRYAARVPFCVSSMGSTPACREKT